MSVLCRFSPISVMIQKLKTKSKKCTITNYCSKKNKMAIWVFFSCSARQCDIINEKREILDRFESQGSIKNVLGKG